jgi:hypothetical protein
MKLGEVYDHVYQPCRTEASRPSGHIVGVRCPELGCGDKWHSLLTVFYLSAAYSSQSSCGPFYVRMKHARRIISLIEVWLCSRLVTKHDR